MEQPFPISQNLHHPYSLVSGSFSKGMSTRWVKQQRVHPPHSRRFFFRKKNMARLLLAMRFLPLALSNHNQLPCPNSSLSFLDFQGLHWLYRWNGLLLGVLLTNSWFLWMKNFAIAVRTVPVSQVTKVAPAVE